MGVIIWDSLKVWVTIASSYVHHPFLLLFWDRAAAQHPVDRLVIDFPKEHECLGSKNRFGSDCTVLFFILIFLCLFWDRGLFSGGCCN